MTAPFRSNHPETDKFIGELLKKSDFQTTFSILSSVKHYLQQNQLNQMFNLDAPKNRFESFMEIVREKHGERAGIFPKVFAHQDKVNEIIKRRGFISEPEHRFFLALLMNVESKEQILSLIKERFPDANPIDKILDWTFDLANTRVLGLNIPNALGIADFGNLDLFIFECFYRECRTKRCARLFAPSFLMKILKNYLIV